MTNQNYSQSVRYWFDIYQFIHLSLKAGHVSCGRWIHISADHFFQSPAPLTVLITINTFTDVKSYNCPLTTATPKKKKNVQCRPRVRLFRFFSVYFTYLVFLFFQVGSSTTYRVRCAKTFRPENITEYTRATDVRDFSKWVYYLRKTWHFRGSNVCIGFRAIWLSGEKSNPCEGKK